MSLWTKKEIIDYLNEQLDEDKRYGLEDNFPEEFILWEDETNS